MPSLIAAAIDLTAEAGASNWQCLFVREPDRAALEAAELLMRRGVQFHWLNRGYRDFTDFLSTFTAEKRKKLKRERRAVSDAGLRIETRHGDEIDDALWPAIHRHYRSTFERLGGYAAFTEDFFRSVGAALGRRMVVFCAFAGEQPVASAICYRDAVGALRPPLGHRHRLSRPAFRAVLPRRHRVRDRPRSAALRTRRAGRTQDRARLRAGVNLVRLLGRRPATA